jgi:hypothetical protein
VFVCLWEGGYREGRGGGAATTTILNQPQHQDLPQHARKLEEGGGEEGGERGRAEGAM